MYSKIKLKARGVVRVSFRIVFFFFVDYTYVRNDHIFRFLSIIHTLIHVRFGSFWFTSATCTRRRGRVSLKSDYGDYSVCVSLAIHIGRRVQPCRRRETRSPGNANVLLWTCGKGKASRRVCIMLLNAVCCLATDNVENKRTKRKKKTIKI